MTVVVCPKCKNWMMMGEKNREDSAFATIANWNAECLKTRNDMKNDDGDDWSDDEKDGEGDEQI